MSSDKMKLLLGGAGGLLVFVVILSYTLRAQFSSEEQSVVFAPQGGEQPVSSGGEGESVLPSSLAPGTKRRSSPLGVITLLSPQAGEKWVIRENHTIEWTKEAGMSGGISLLDARTRAVVGWLISTTNQHDTSYTWNTREVFLARGSPSKKDIAAGEYIVKMTFDGPRTPIESAIFSVVHSTEIATESYPVSIQNFVFVPNIITVKRGAKVTFTNQDAVIHKLLSVGIATSYTIEPGQSVAIETANMNVGKYEYYSPQYASLVFRLTVE